MRAFILFLSLITCINIQAEIKYEINKYKIMRVEFRSSNPTIDELKKDWNEAISIASSNKKIKQVHFINANNTTFIWFTRENLNTAQSELDKLIEEASKNDKSEPIYGEKVEKVRDIPASYHSDTYINGKLESTFVSDWEHGYIEPTTSTYKTSDGKTYVTKTYVKLARKEKYWETPVIGVKKVKDGITEMLKSIYKITTP